MWMELLASFITFLGPLFMRYYPFRKKLRIPVWALGLTVVVVWAGVVAALLAFGYSEEHSADIYRNITFVLFFIMSCFVIRDRFVRHFFVYLIFLHADGGEYRHRPVCHGASRRRISDHDSFYPAV